MSTNIQIEKLSNSEFHLLREGRSVPVRIRRCFPWSEPTRFITVRDMEENELAIIDDLDRLDATVRDAVEDALSETDFVLQVEKVLSLETEVDIRVWKVQTRQGLCQFQTKIDDWPQKLPGGGMLFRDVVGNIYHIAAPGKMDEKSRKLLWAYID